jgi:hypothetical protein
MNIKYISDFSVSEIIGGAEIVDNTIIKYLNIEFIKSKDWYLGCNNFLIISNISMMPQEKIDYIKNNCNYIIIEHDYKIHRTRHPWRFKDSIVPKDERINYDLYRNAKAVFTQTDDHLQVFKDNEVEGNFISLKCSMWSDLELEMLSKLQNNKNTHKFAVIDSDNWIKNKQGAEQFCKINKFDYEFIPKLGYSEFLLKLSQYPALVFFPVARETCCRLLVEARCMNLNVLTSNNSGAFKSDWFIQSGENLINFIKLQTKINFNNIKKHIPQKELIL